MKLKDNIESVHIYKTPCVFAPGDLGQHTVQVTVGTNGSIKHVDCECLQRTTEKHLDGMIALDKSNSKKTCYGQILTLRDIVTGGDASYFAGRSAYAGYDNALSKSKQKHRDRLYAKERNKAAIVAHTIPQRKALFLQKAFAKYAHIDPELVAVKPFQSEVHPDCHFSLTMGGYVIGHRTVKGVWTAEREHYRNLYIGTVYSNLPRGYDGRCGICQKNFKRIATHAQSEKHHKEVKRRIDIGMQSTTTDGLRIRNKYA